MPPPLNQSCGNCDYRIGNACHRVAPTPVGFQSTAQWSRVKINDWCGMWSMIGSNSGGTEGPPGPQGPPGPTAVSSDPDNLAILGTDNLLLVPNKYAFKGVVDGSDALQGNVAEYKTTENVTGVAMNANVPLAICTLPLPPGCWEIWGACDFTVASVEVETQAGAPIQPNQLGSSISVTPDSLPTDQELILGTGVMNLIYSPLAPGQRQVLTTGQCRSNSTDPIDLYLVAQIGLGNANVKGYISARRVR